MSTKGQTNASRSSCALVETETMPELAASLEKKSRETSSPASLTMSCCLVLLMVMMALMLDSDDSLFVVSPLKSLVKKDVEVACVAETDAGVNPYTLPKQGGSRLHNETPGEEDEVTEHQERNPLQSLLRDVGVLDDDANEREITTLLPKWSDLTALYGPLKEPIILGTETCEKYRATVPYEQRYVGVAGMYNSGTNAMTFHLGKNINFSNSFQVPWTKHIPPSFRWNQTAEADADRVRNVFPIVVVRDPLHWQQSMCGSQYRAEWLHSKHRCPNLVATDEDHKRFSKNPKYHELINETFIVRVHYQNNQTVSWRSLVDVWSDYYKQYVQADFPRLIVRFEDMIFMAPQIMKQIAECVGGTTPQDEGKEFQYQTGSSKKHGSHSDLLKVIAKTGNTTAREQGLTTEDLLYAATHLDREVMDFFQYALPVAQNASGRTR